MARIPLPDPQGKGDFHHAAAGRERDRLFVAHPCNDCVEVVDLRTRRYLRSLRGGQGRRRGLGGRPVAGVVHLRSTRGYGLRLSDPGDGGRGTSPGSHRGETEWPGRRPEPAALDDRVCGGPGGNQSPPSGDFSGPPGAGDVEPSHPSRARSLSPRTASLRTRSWWSWRSRRPSSPYRRRSPPSWSGSFPSPLGVPMDPSVVRGDGRSPESLTKRPARARRKDGQGCPSRSPPGGAGRSPVRPRDPASLRCHRGTGEGRGVGHRPSSYSRDGGHRPGRSHLDGGPSTA